MQARCQLQRRPTFLPSNFYFLRARQGGRSHHATNYESGAKCSADIRVPLAPPSGSAVAAGLRSAACCLRPRHRRARTLSLLEKHVRESVVATRVLPHTMQRRVNRAGCHPLSNTTDDYSVTTIARFWFARYQLSLLIFGNRAVGA